MRVPGTLVRIQLLAIPGDERKFNRRIIVASLPTCNCERAVASSHALALGSACAVAVIVGPGSGVLVAVETDVLVALGDDS